MTRSLLATLLLVLLPACYTRFPSHGNAYSNLTTPQGMLTALEGPVLDSGSRSSSGGSSSGPGGWSSSQRATAWFSCEPKDREAIEDELFELVQEDIFGCGFFLVDEGVRLERLATTGPTSSGTTVMQFAWEASGSEGQLEININPSSTPDEFTMVWAFEEGNV